MYRVRIFLPIFLLSILVLGKSAPFVSNENNISPSTVSEKPQEIVKKETPPQNPDLNLALPNFLISLGLVIAALSLVSPWLTIGIGLGLLFLILILVLLIDPDKLKPKNGKGVVGKIIAIIFGLLLAFLLMALLIVGVVIGLALLVGGLIGIATSPIWGGLAISIIGFLLLLGTIIVYWIRKARYKRYKKTDLRQS